MIFDLRSRLWAWVSLLGCALLLSVLARPAAAAPESQFVDGIAAVVDEHVITLNQLDARAREVRGQMRQQGVPAPDEAVLRRQVLQQMINDALQAQEAQRVGIRVDDGQVERAIDSIARRNQLSLEQLKNEILASGIDWDTYRNELRTEIRNDALRHRFVEDRIHISDSDVDAFLQTHPDVPAQTTPAAAPSAPAEAPPPAARPTGPELIELAQILIEVPEQAGQAVMQQKRSEAQAILRKLQGGADFAGVAAASSDGPQALEGGDMGIRPLKDWPDLFVQAVRDLPAGAVSAVIQSGRGFHILKVLRRGYAQRPAPARQEAAAAPAPAAERPAPSPAASKGPVMVTQTHARHILIKLSQVVDDDKARRTLEGLRTRLENGESFAELARRYSEDASAPQGGDLGWLSPGETVPEFEEAMNGLQDGQISEPVKTRFGWHLIQVEGRRTQDMGKTYQRIQARQVLLQGRIGPAYEDWLEQLRSRAYIDNRLEKAAARAEP